MYIDDPSITVLQSHVQQWLSVPFANLDTLFLVTPSFCALIDACYRKVVLLEVKVVFCMKVAMK